MTVFDAFGASGSNRLRRRRLGAALVAALFLVALAALGLIKGFALAVVVLAKMLGGAIMLLGAVLWARERRRQGAKSRAPHPNAES